ncbi:MAG: NAD-dependent DNA ligase LigA, partial [Mangrovicoccus sp.]
MAQEKDIATLSEEQAATELDQLAKLISSADQAYHGDDDPSIDDAEYDQLKQRNAALEAAFPHLKRADSPSDRVGAPVSSGFAKIKHSVRMLSLGNAFSPEDVADFDTSIRRYLGLGSDAALSYTAEPKIDGLSLSIRYEKGQMVYAATRGDG